MSRVTGNNRKQLTLLAALLTVILSISGKADAGVGMLEQGEHLITGNLNFTAADKHWDVSRNTIDSICKARNFGATVGYEYGWSYFHTVYANIGMGYRRCGQRGLPGPGVLVTGNAKGLADIELGVRTRFSGHYLDSAAWEAFLIIPTGYNNGPSALGKGALGAGLGVLFSSDPSHNFPFRTWRVNSRKWGWKAGSKFTYFFSGKGNTLRSYAAIQYAVTETDFVRTGDYFDLRLINSIGFANRGVQNAIFVNQAVGSITSSDQTSIQISYTHSFIGTGWSANILFGKALYGRNAPISWYTGLGASYRWRD
ncbi:hypothetical protein MMIC_P0739 [Mariprofundus micogutta]|uniref:Transporter n=1 Tax=Mariprofundus micogutta TaxID=1921010 RepID=A0A1L8CLK9_9PROT|nr:hypothetical protein [Mariprofundus micogutta]GAV19781.1 hypothetical protein MMIC_P0739 [Mariprofundus micogutta]